MNQNRYFSHLTGLLRGRPHALANVSGSAAYPRVQGQVRFYQTVAGVLVVAEIEGLPTSEGACTHPVFGFHIHGGGECRGDGEDPFSAVGGHYNPYDCPHPYHAGDLPPLWGADGYAFSAFLTNRFSVDEIIGKTVIIHAGIDDFTSQPAGNAGAKMGCGEIVGR